MHKTSLLGLLVALVLAGCSEASAPEPGGFTRTIVELHQDGTSSVQVEKLDDGPADAALPPQVGCISAALHLYSLPNFTGNQICFYGDGVVDLGQYLCGGLTWDGQVASYSTNLSHGHFEQVEPGNPAPVAVEAFTTGQDVGLASTMVRRANRIDLKLAPPTCVPRRCPAHSCGVFDDGCGGELCCTSSCPGHLCQPEEP